MSANAAPIRWMHVPKTGTSFQLALVAWGCSREAFKSLASTSSLAFDFQSPMCSGSFTANSGGDHHPLSTTDRVTGRVVSLFRAPKTRIASGYAHDFHDCPPLRERFNCSDVNKYDCARQPAVVMQRERVVLEYARCVDGCTTRMIMGMPCGRHDLPFHQALTKETTERAIAQRIAAENVVSRQFVFLGDTDHWRLSICQFVSIYKPLHHEAGYDIPKLFHNIRATRSKDLEMHARTVLDRVRWNDTDVPLYRKAVARMTQINAMLVNNSEYHTCLAS